MKFLAVLLLTAVAYGARYERAATTKIPGSFLIKIKEGVSLNGFVSLFKGMFSEGKVNFKWDALNTISVHLPEAFVEELLSLDDIDYVEEDGVFYTQQVTASWGLDRVDQRYLPLDHTYYPPRAAIQQTVYVIDTGIRHSHVDFGGRAAYHWDYQNDNGGEDCNGHGTHCAGTVGGATYGVALGVNLRSVRVFDCFGSGSLTNVIFGVNSVPSGVGSMSLGGGASSSLDAAVADAVGCGVVMTAAAGNDNANACFYSPSREPSAITVAATTPSDARSPFSNYGSCVDIFAPGSSIPSTWHTSRFAANTMSGTSMACSHVSGAAALLLVRGVPAGSVPRTMISGGTSNVISDPGPHFPNKLLYVI